MRLIDWILGLFAKPKEEVNTEVWLFPVPAKPKRKYVRKAKKPVVKKAAVKKVVKKTVKKKAK